MIARLLLATAALTVGASAAHADPRIATHLYAPSDIVALRGHMGVESTIAFAPDERIENVAVGDSAAWQVTPNKRADLLFVKPLASHARTNMTVVTDQHTYLFDLVSAAGTPVYMLRFTYPYRPKPVLPAAAPAVAVAAEAPPKPLPKPLAAPLDFAWVAKGDAKLLPAAYFDDGHATYLKWPRDASLPAILTPEPRGSEGPVNYTVRGDYIVVEGVPAELILREGKKMATLTLAPSQPRHDAAAPIEETSATADTRLAAAGSPR